VQRPTVAGSARRGARSGARCEGLSRASPARARHELSRSAGPRYTPCETLRGAPPNLTEKTMEHNKNHREGGANERRRHV
jgi:hypothetical protein